MRKRDDICVIDPKNQTQETDLTTQRMEEQMETLATVEGSDGRSTDAFLTQRNDLRTQQSMKWKEKMDHQRRKETVLSKAKFIPVEDDEQPHNKMGLRVDGHTRMKMIKDDQELRKSDDLCFKDLNEQREEQNKRLATIGKYGRARDTFVAERNERRTQLRAKWKERVDHRRQNDTILKKVQEILVKDDKHIQNIISHQEEEDTTMKMIKGDQELREVDNLENHTQGIHLINQRREEHSERLARIGGYLRPRDTFVAERNELRTHNRIEWMEIMSKQRRKNTILRKAKEKLVKDEEQSHNIIGQHEEENIRQRMMMDDEVRSMSADSSINDLTIQLQGIDLMNQRREEQNERFETYNNIKIYNITGIVMGGFKK